MSVFNSMSDILQQVERKIIEGVKPDIKEDFDKIVAAGLKVGFSRKMNKQLFDPIFKSKNPYHDLAIGTVGLLLILHEKSGGTMPLPPMVPAGMVLLLHAMDFYEKGSGQKIDNDKLEAAMQTFLETLLPKLGVPQDVMRGAIAKAAPFLSNQNFMQKFKEGQYGYTG